MRVLHSDKNGQWISETMTTPLEGGGAKTNVSWADGTTIVMTETADGVRTGRGFRRLASGFLDVRVRRYCGRGSSVSEVKPMFAVALVTAVCGTLGLFCAVWTFRLFAQGDYLTMLVVAGFMVFAFGLLAVRLLAEMGTVAPRIEYGDRGTILRPDPKVDRLSLIATFAAFASMLLYAVFGSLGMAKLPGPAGDQKWFVLSCIAGVVLGLPSLWRIASQGGMSYLRLSDSGLKIGDAYSRAEYRWDEVSEVSDLSRHRQWAHSAGSTYLATTDGRTRLLASDWFTPHGRALRKLMRFYWRYPECRDELTDGRAARRLEDSW